MVTRAFCSLILAGSFGFTAGCSLLHASKGEPDKSSAELRLVDQQLQLQRFADDFFARGAQGLDESADRLGTDEGREKVLRVKVLLGSSVLSIVSGPNPNVNLLDLVSVTMLTRRSIEDYWMHTTNGAAFQPWLDASRVLETNVWNLAARFLQPAQVAELRAGINKWYAATPEVRTAFFARPYAFAQMVRTTQEKDAPKTSVFSLINLTPAVAEVTQSRLFAERAMYAAQRMPFMLRLQGEQFSYEVADQPAFRLSLSNSTLVSESLASVSQTVSQLPDRIAAERKEILAELRSQQGNLRDLTADVDRALVSGEKMSTSLSIALTNAKGFVETFRAGGRSTNTPPFRILDYDKTAEDISAMAQNVNAAIGSMNQSEGEIRRLSLQISADMEKVQNRGFWLCLVLIAVLVLAGLVYRFFAEKLKRRAAAGSG